ncbi:MAG TPA: hypothetical protein DEA40_05670 [Parvularcula sp.]|nr:hypothetical protein [Parvularcula sp.]HBS36368.1 hypothetical protein [Parvularcula sp.]
MRTFGRVMRKVAYFAAVGAAALGAAPAFAAGTSAGTSVANSFTLDYQVGGVSQTQINTSGAPTRFTVDRKVDLTVTTVANATVSPGQTGARVVYGVLNSGNDNTAWRLSIKDIAADTFDIGTYTARFYTDAGNDGVFTPGVDDAGAGTAYTLGAGVTPNVAPDARLWVILTGNVPAGATNGQFDDVALIANSFYPTASLDPAYASTPGTEITAAATNTLTGAAQDVLADGTGTAGAPEDVANDGAHSSTARYTVAAAAVTANKTVSVIRTNPTNCATDTVIANSFATPGACVEYVISASNAAGAAATASAIAISDVLPNEVQWVSSAQAGFTAAGTLTNPAGGAGCTSACTVSLTGASLAPGATGTVTIRALVR